MANPSSALDHGAMMRAKSLLERPEARQRLWPALGAAVFLALSALAFATAMLMAPPLVSEHVAPARGAA